MKRIRLLTLTSFNYLIVYAILSIITFGLFFYFYKAGITHSMDEALDNRKLRIISEIEKNGNHIPANTFNLTDFRMYPVSGAGYKKDSYSDTTMLEGDREEEEEYVPFRKLTSYVNIASLPYKMEIVVPVVEKETFSQSLLKAGLLAFLFMIITFLIFTRLLSKKIWQNFYETLTNLRSFDLNRSKPLLFTSTRIEEFYNLNEALTEMAERTRLTYVNQKQFIENVSHELQTPLAINQNKLEQLADDPDLTAGQSEIVQTLINSTQRITRLNKTLLLLSKIENGQFPETDQIQLASLIKESLDYFDDMKSKGKITVITCLDEHTYVTANKTLVELLINNLIKNSFVHNISGGMINITLKENELSIINNSLLPPIPKEKLFQRFFKNTNRKESWGLGLPMVKKICQMQNWLISYHVEEHLHSFIITF